MTSRLNEFNQPIGPALPHWTPRARPSATPGQGHYCRLEHLEPAQHAEALHAAYAQAPDARDWTYMPAGPFADAASYREWAERAAASVDPYHYTVTDTRTQQPVGTLSLMRIEPVHGVIEVGNVMFSPLLKRTPLSTEAQFLLMKHAFDELGYRRFEWKCDHLNAPSRQAAARLGFTFEGIFRQALVYKGRSRDTAWFSIIDSEWPALRAEFERWLNPDNFDAQGQQRTPLRHAARG